MILEPRGPKIDQNGAQERSEKDLGNWGGNLGSPSNSILRLLAHLGDFGRHLVPQLGAKGLPKSSFLAPSRTKISKNEAQNEASKNVWNFDRNLRRKCEILNVLNPPKYYVWRHSGGWRILWQSRKNNEQICQKGPNIDAKIDIWAIRGPTFEVLGHVLRTAIFLWFLRCAKIDQKWRKFEAIGIQGKFHGNFGEGRRQRRSSWEPVFTSFGNKFWQNIWHA